ncbi:MAG: cobyrinate a,c-diamide synthase [Desulfovibrionaceae bacterium]
MTKILTISGTHSGCGKTSVSLGLMAALTRRGLTVQAFKAGPDFIDPGLHQIATGRPAHNIDGWMLGRDMVRDIVARHAADADVAIVEGGMGLFDGASGSDETGSTAQIAKWLDAPVLLVLDSRSMARSAAAMARGYLDFDPQLAFAGVVCNRVGSDNHEALLREALECAGVPVAGCLRREDAIAMPSRHLGLVTADAMPRGAVPRLADWVAQAIEPQRLLAAMGDLRLPPPQSAAMPEPSLRSVRIGVALDEAFCFYYLENLRHLIEAGAELAFFSPLRDTALPEGCDGLYLGGGYPELHAATLAANEAMRGAVRAFSLSQRPVYAECGGFMYLMDGIEGPKDADGAYHPMAGVYAMRCRMDARFRALGYREASTTAPSLLGPAWTVLRGHEFHYSHIVALDPDATPLYKLRDRRDWLLQKEGFVRGNTLGSYVHLHFGSNPDAARAFVAACATSRDERIHAQ